MFGVDRNEFFKTDDADFSMEPFNGVSNGGEHPAWVNTRAAKWLRSYDSLERD